MGTAGLFGVAGSGAHHASVSRQIARPAAGKPAERPDPGDFNGDGYDDFVDVVVSKSADGRRYAASLVVVYGSRAGLDTATARRTPAGSGRYATFLSAPLRADLDGDGFTDLVGSRGVNGSGSESFALFGGAHGLGAARRLGLPAGFRPMAAADFDGDGSVDLLDTGHGGSDDPHTTGQGGDGLLLHGPFDRAGTSAGRAVLDLRRQGVTPDSATTGDFDGDGRAEVVFMYSYDVEEEETVPAGLHSAGVYEGGDQGLVRDTRQEAAIEHLASTDDGPRTPASGDADGDGLDDLLVPTRLAVAPADMPGAGGALTILYGAKSGLGTGRARTVIGGTRGTDRRRVDFGSSPAVGDVDGDGRPDVVVNTPDFRRHDGKVTLLRGGADGAQSLDREQVTDAESDGLPGTPNPYYWNAFGYRPPLLDVDGDRHADAVVFGPLYEKRKGAYLVLRGADDGFDPAKARLFTPDDIGVPLRLT
ncbi:FG-GAP and VCBS repeat-containing protein [Streptomyces lucensis]|uniref:FG-GAP and VCBS repeat-containing protein n=1 Tax=Streptomyces lucensis TaxID=67319 RepID=UPI00167871FF|nr:FG-GAP and VCBS repeat-containing protein [Streptomyces lucensis]